MSQSSASSYWVAFLIGNVLNSFWTGVMQVQTYMFFRKFPKDPFYVKLIVGALWYGDLFSRCSMPPSNDAINRRSSQTFFFFSCFSLAYYELIKGMKDPALLYVVPWTLRYLSTQRAITTTLTQTYFVSRLWRYGRNVYMTSLLVVLVGTTLAFGIQNNYDNWLVPVSGNYYYWSQRAWSISIVITDALISGYLFFLMRRGRDGFKSTSSIMRLITVYGVATGGVSSILAIIILVSSESKWLGIMINFTMWSSPVVICAVLANLHLRSALRALIPKEESIPMPSFSLHVLGRISRPFRHPATIIAEPPTSSVPSTPTDQTPTSPDLSLQHHRSTASENSHNTKEASSTSTSLPQSVEPEAGSSLPALSPPPPLLKPQSEDARGVTMVGTRFSIEEIYPAPQR
ncbi:hypothetical protein DL93DRAFT_1148816 [Clavulina sp. PMI_390]|nr:hypothetical protein DL93DRAFT_1148816 [Clavulina sp. PMI_390]